MFAYVGDLILFGNLSDDVIDVAYVVDTDVSLIRNY